MRLLARHEVGERDALLPGDLDQPVDRLAGSKQVEVAVESTAASREPPRPQMADSFR
jgi:hypothetical protein